MNITHAITINIADTDIDTTFSDTETDIDTVTNNINVTNVITINISDTDIDKVRENIEHC